MIAKYKKHIIPTALFFCSIGVLNAQNITIQNTQTPTELVEDVLLGIGVTAYDITVNGTAANANMIRQNVTYFEANGTNFPIERGVLLSTGQGIGAIGPNNSTSFTQATTHSSTVTDPNLQAIAPGAMNNGVVLEFKFIPTGDSISFRYMFGSDEYPEFAPSTFNDAFGFFLFGPSPTDPVGDPNFYNGTNIALLPSPPAAPNTPVTINNVNPTTNNTFYVNNNNAPHFYGNAIQYDGTTVVLTASAQVACNEEYTIKLAIANVGDNSYDSGVFLEAESFKTNVVTFSAVPSVINDFTDTLLAEGCISSTIYFVRPQNQTDTSMTYYFDWEGTADPYADFDHWQDSVFFDIGEDSVAFTITPSLDGIEEPDEYITVIGYSVTECGDTLYNYLTLWITDEYPFSFELPENPEIVCLTDSAFVSVSNIQGSVPEYSYLWSTGDTTEGIWLFPGENTQDSIMYYVDVIDGCGRPERDTIYLIVNQTLQVDTTYSFPTPCGLQEGAVVAIVSGTTGPQNGVEYEWSGPGEDSPNTYNATVWQELSPGWYYFYVEDQVCQAFDSVFVDIENPPVANVSANPTEGYSPLTVNFTNESENASTYYWWFGNGNDLNIDNMSGQTQVYDTVPGTYTMFLVAYEGGCMDTAYASFTILEFIPGPEVATPNTFTPNGDGINDLWIFTVLNYVEEVNVSITNRWGNLIYETTSSNPTWDGKDMSGKQMTEGVYFYKYRAVGLNGDVLEGHGFIQLHR